jgi:sortase (surface protein transpeptidase)
VVLATVLLLLGAGCLLAGLRQHQHPLAAPAASGRATASTTTAPPPTATTIPPVARSVPASLAIPAIGLEVSVSSLGLNPDGTVQVPTNVQEPGWFQLGPSPGQVGSAVILGHVDSYRGPAVFFELRSLQAGDAVEVTLADGVTTHFVVTSVAMYPKTQFPAQQVYLSHGYSALQLVTCGGAFDPQTGHYLSNVVVYTSFVAATPPPDPTASRVRLGN